ncbi:hypothetical protein FRC12_004272 [Ceratobasidium sp. 428]|nr:hypothetical protein FRC12_004272 [Ceratobasidium sp. 428]
MSEEQKYHKSVYQEPRGRGRGGGQRGRGGRGGSGRVPYRGSGENAIPLGQTNAWTAPPPDPVNNAPFDSTGWTATTEPVAKPAPVSQADVPEPDLKQSKRSKKRKLEDVEMSEPTAAEKQGSAPEPEPVAQPTTDKREKKRKRNLQGLEATNKDEDVVMADAVAANGKEKEPEQSRKSNGEPLAMSEPDEGLSPKKKKSRKSEAKNDESTTSVEPVTSIDSETTTNGYSTGKKHKKDKKLKADKSNGISPLPASDEPHSAPETADLIPLSNIESDIHLSKKERQKKEKKEKKEQAKAEAKARKAEALDALKPPVHQLSNVVLVGGEADSEVMSKPSKPKKEKKREKGRTAEGAEETGGSEDIPKEKRKKSKREKKEKDIITT